MSGPPVSGLREEGLTTGPRYRTGPPFRTGPQRTVLRLSRTAWWPEPGRAPALPGKAAGSVLFMKT